MFILTLPVVLGYRFQYGVKEIRKIEDTYVRIVNAWTDSCT